MDIIKKALKVMEAQLQGKFDQFTSSEKVKSYCRLQMGLEKDEVFGVLFLDNYNRLIEYHSLFRGTVNESSVYLRPIIRKIIELNAAKVIFTHNHPSGISKPSEEDIKLTNKFSAFLKEIDVQVLDHIIVTTTEAISMAELHLI